MIVLQMMLKLMLGEVGKSGEGASVCPNQLGSVAIRRHGVAEHERKPKWVMFYAWDI
jgi:hypothetical protein